MTSNSMASSANDTTMNTRSWVAFGPNGAVGSIHETDGTYSYKLIDESEFRGRFETLDAAKGALMASLPTGSERPEFKEH